METKLDLTKEEAQAAMMALDLQAELTATTCNTPEEDWPHYDEVAYEFLAYKKLKQWFLDNYGEYD